MLNGTAPKVQYFDGVWNHGEGFSNQTSVDVGGWFNHNDGSFLTNADIHQWNGQGWVPYTWENDFHPASPRTVDRMQGYLRPAGIALPTYHPRYGDLSPSAWVDSGAFEIFRPRGIAYNGQKILIVINCSATTQFAHAFVAPGSPAAKYESFSWGSTYSGLFSPDGLVRSEFALANPTGSPPFPGTNEARTLFLNNTDPGDVQRLEPAMVATWDQTHANYSAYWPICGYPVLSVPHRQTELNEQRQLQLAQAIKLLLQENSPRNPLYDAGGNPIQLTQTQVDQIVVVVFAGGSNGGTQSSFTVQRHPEIVHGCYAQVINSGMQRLLGEQDLGYAVSELSGSNLLGATVGPGDFLDWCQYSWNQGVEIHDLSFIRRFFAGTTYRPGFFYVGDEDITSTGTDWIRVVNGVAWTPSGLRTSSAGFGNNAYNSFAWMSAENTEHGVGFAVDPYNLGTPPTGLIGDTLHSLALHAVNQRAAQLASSQNVPFPYVPSNPRTASQQLRGLDEPHEWFFGRSNNAYLPASIETDPLIRDDGFNTAIQPGAAGTWLGHEEAILIHDGRVYVGSADGFVSSFDVDQGHPKEPLVRVAQSPRLGHRAFGLAVIDSGGTSSIVAATRRHLHKLDIGSLAVTQQVQLPWEVAQPHGLRVADVLPGNPGQELVFRSVHGGLVFYDTNLAPVFEWPEPGIEDFEVVGSSVTILSSRRAVLANVSFVTQANYAMASAISKPLPTSPTDLPTQGNPADLERMLFNLGGQAFPAFISLWRGDSDGQAVRVHEPTQLTRVPAPTLTHLGTQFGGAVVDIDTCVESLSAGQIGDNLLVLTSERIAMFDQAGTLLGNVAVNKSGAGLGNYYPFGNQPCAMAVGNLGVPPMGGYYEQVVVATQSGHLFWIHVGEIANGQSALTNLPSHYDVVTTSGGFVPGTEVQPRTNQALAATWSIARHPSDNRLHLLDQNGAYWKVDHTGAMELWDCNGLARNTKGWAHLGPLNGFTGPLGSSGFVNTSPVGLGLVTAFQTLPWFPDWGKVVFYEGTSHYRPYNWLRGQSLLGVFDGMFLFRQAGGLVQNAIGAEAWFWSTNFVAGVGGFSRDPWGNHIEGINVLSAGDVSGIWASSGIPAVENAQTGRGNLTPYHDLRSLEPAIPAMHQQAAIPLKLSTGETVVVLGCPGGRVRGIIPGTMRTGSTPHAIGRLESTAEDLGLGGSALAAEVRPGDIVRVWIGTLYDHVKQPAAYGSATGSLLDDELAVGAVHMVDWTPNQGFGPVLVSRRLQPTATSRGGYGVVGLLLTDLFPQEAGNELVVATMSGDLFVFAADTMQELWRLHVPGSIGFYNSMVAHDFDGVGGKELYVSGSRGLWRFNLP